MKNMDVKEARKITFEKYLNTIKTIGFSLIDKDLKASGPEWIILHAMSVLDETMMIKSKE